MVFPTSWNVFRRICVPQTTGFDMLQGMICYKVICYKVICYKVICYKVIRYDCICIGSI